MTRVVDMVQARDGRVVGLRCSRCGVIFANRPGNAWRDHDDHTWACLAVVAEAAGVEPMELLRDEASALVVSSGA